MEKLLNEQVVSQISQTFEQMKEPVQILFFGSQDNCEYCTDTRQLLEEVAGIDEKVSLNFYDIKENADMAAKFNVERVPAIVIAAKDGDQVTDFGIQYSGIPAGHEFGTLINDIVLVSGRDSGLSAEAREYLKNLDKPLHLQVFVTPTCPHCPRAVLLAHQMAMENPAMIRAEGVEATEFPELANQFNVRGVPQTVINAGMGTVVGAMPEKNLLAEIMRAVN
ncbi:MAG TPA: thioredoxin family protein [Anaerolineales bacterium]|nr:thioredoxin family protein [Anaerolineales bacterium]HQX01710.1 thioredoxin family protein [Anaerolineales bacterium]